MRWLRAHNGILHSNAGTKSRHDVSVFIQLVASFVLVLLTIGVQNAVCGIDTKNAVGLYEGKGAVCAQDVATALNKLHISHVAISESDIAEGTKLKSILLLIMPGGKTAEMFSSLKGKGFENIRTFVADGGGYLGICAGAYLAAPRVNIPFHPRGLGIINIDTKRVGNPGICSILIKKQHPITTGYSDSIKIFFLNGPLMIPADKDIEVLASFADEDAAAIALSKYKKGYVLVFSPHPEGMASFNADPEIIGTLKLLGNSIRFFIEGKSK